MASTNSEQVVRECAFDIIKIAQAHKDDNAKLIKALQEPLSVEEWKQLMTGAQVPGAGQRVPLFAGGGDPGAVEPDKEQIAKNFPNAVKKTFR